MFRERNISEVWYDLKTDIEDLLETIDDICPKDIETFNEINGWKEKIKAIRNEVVDNLTTTLETEE